MPIPVSENRNWWIPTVDGVWVGDRIGDPLPEDLSEVDYRHEAYYRVGDGDDAEYVHVSLLDERPSDLPPGSEPRGG
jgi:hypothetical protein